MKDKTAFGIGCFHFGIARHPPFTFQTSNYESDLETALKAIPTLNNITIDCDKDFYDVFEISEAETLDREKSGEFFPLPSMELSFDVYIPFHVQKEIYPFESGPSRTFTENFMVSVYYTYYTPVCFIEPINPSKTSDPSEAVVLVREHLQREFNDLQANIRFDVLGPSPFHADCFIESFHEEIKESREKIFDAYHLKIRGYDKIIFRYHEEDFETVEDVKTSLYKLISEELGLFYQLQLDSISALDDWLEIQDILEKISNPAKVNWIMRLARNIFLRGKRISALFEKVSAFEANQIITKGSTNRAYSDCYSTDEPKFLQHYIDREIKEKTEYPTKQTIELAGFLENKRSKNLEMIIVLLAAIIGGALGSLLTIALAK